MNDPRKPTIAEFDTPPQIDSGDSRTWVVRAANFIVSLSKCAAGARLAEQNAVDESFIHVASGSARITAGGETHEIDDDSLAILPPGAHEIVAGAGAVIIRISTARETALAEIASNAARYATTEGVAPLEPWPMPRDGYRLRVYRLSDYDREDNLMRLFRTRLLMVNAFRRREEPRDIRKLSPHSHEDFEQGSLSLKGEWAHNLRHPWTADMTTWLPDEEIRVGSPSLLIIPPKVIHTSRNTSEGWSRLMDVFAGPRLDFSMRPGLVCNHDEYPMTPDH